MGWIKSLLGFLDKLFAFINTQQLKKAGKDEARIETMEADNEARKKAKKIIEDNSNLDAESVVIKLRKYKRKD